jgi:hypothetical protein
MDFMWLIPRYVSCKRHASSFPLPHAASRVNALEG